MEDGSAHTASGGMTDAPCPHAYLSDVFIVESRRGRGLGMWLVERIVAHPDFQRPRRFALFTRDAQALHTPFGSGPATGSSTYMEIRNPDVYSR